MRAALLLLIPLMVQAQLAVFTTPDGTIETPVGATYNFGAVANGNTQSTRFRVFNNGTSPVTVYGPQVNGAGFAVTAVNGILPYTIPAVSAAPLNFFEFSVTFTAGAAANYSASLQISGPSINTINIVLLGTSTPGATLSAIPPGCSPDGSGGVAFAAVTIGAQGVCNFGLTNTNSVAVVISSIRVSGAGFSISQQPNLPFTLAAGAGTSFIVQFNPQCGQAAYSGSLTVNTTAYALGGSGITPALPQPSLNFDTQTFTSNQQHTLSISLPSPSVCGASGNVNLAFTPAGTLPDDSTIAFMSGNTRSLPFTIAPGTSQATISGNTSATFSTGTTAGTISFTLAAPNISAGPPSASFTIAPAAIYIDSTIASNQVLGQLNITLSGYDNTQSAGEMTFTFFDASGKAIGSPITADSKLQAFFQSFAPGAQNGTFELAVSFPVEGSCVPGPTSLTCQPNQVVASVQVTLSNSAGPTQTGTLTFQ